jgi:hypothetical protein
MASRNVATASDALPLNSDAVGSRATSARFRPHAVQNTPAPGGSPQNGQTRVLGSTLAA